MPEVRLRTIKAGTGMTVTNNADDITLAAGTEDTLGWTLDRFCGWILPASARLTMNSGSAITGTEAFVTAPTDSVTDVNVNFRRNTYTSTTINAVPGITTTAIGFRIFGQKVFRAFMRFGLTNIAVANTGKAFIGFSVNTASTVADFLVSATEPSAKVNCIGVAYDSTDATGNWQVMHNDAAGACTVIDTTVVRSANELMELYLELNATGTSWIVRLYKVAFAGGVITRTLAYENTAIAANIPVVGAGAGYALGGACHKSTAESRALILHGFWWDWAI